MQDQRHTTSVRTPSKKQATLTNGLVDFLPPWPLGLQRALLQQDRSKIQLSHSTGDVNLTDFLELGLLDELEKNKHDEDDWCGQICQEETLDALSCGHRTVSNWSESGPELGDKN